MTPTPREEKKCRHPQSKRVCKWIGFCLVSEKCGVCKKVLSKNYSKEEEENIPGFAITTKG